MILVLRLNDWNSYMYFLYILECEDGTLYTGITTDVKKRFERHAKGRGAKYTRAHKPKKIVYTEKHNSLSSALKREALVKKFPRSRKIRLIQVNS